LSGPGRLCQAFSITRQRDNDKDMLSLRSDLQVKDDGFKTGKILVTPRIGIVKSAAMPLRYLLAENRFVSAK
jgi:DNA-3-methyladenine glycosylase